MNSIPLALNHTTESSDKLTELLWQDALRHLGSTNNEVLLPINVIDMIGQSNVDKIKSRLCALIGAPVVAFVDESINALRVMRTPAFSGTTISVASHEVASCLEFKSIKVPMKKHERSSVPVKAAKVPRPPNAFILYRQHHHPKLKEAHPNLSNNEISVILGKQWKAESEDIRVEFKALADELKRKHAEAHPDYQYTPRRPFEKKRRTLSRQYPKSTAEYKSPDLTTTSTETTSPSIDTNVQIDDTGIEGTMNFFPEYNMPIMHTGDILYNDLIPSDMPLLSDEHFQLDPEILGSLIAHVQTDFGKGTGLCTPPSTHISFTDRHIGETIEFSDYITDLY
ncbi:mating-type HMG-box protein MAT1-2 [Aspergillus sclerotioniger CBS 115572]|uniref:Mating-type HMG-box protein MAT1-2 n=1 Tax=Aspergillus sclerotioniger CBS 115572 TaxID=1450535 RepID=A0A317VYR4_9EURO|nr:mating-type HMG-box protein MAT1-2 [Aspergillus sclerotioniger CBS 115572]PWY79413.1 mating-type HMG-box protein MAT1-2 [Aspergillus sclerotioniger CBS 115572]